MDTADLQDIATTAAPAVEASLTLTLTSDGKLECATQGIPTMSVPTFLRRAAVELERKLVEG